MRSDERAAEEKTTPAAGAKDDISADDLLKLLHASVEKSPSKSDNASVVKKTPRTASKPLEIDESVYQSAERELHKNEQTVSADDSELDIEALIDKYIKRRDKTEEDKSPDGDLPITGEIVKQLEVPEPAAEDLPTSEYSESEPEELPEEFYESVTQTEDAEPSQEPDEPSDFAEPSDYAEPAAEPSDIRSDEPSGDADDESLAYQTAVFDIKKVNEAAGEDRADDGAYISAATEEFTPVHVAQESKTEKVVEPLAGTHTYGAPDTDEIDQTDLNLMIAFGMNDELKDTVGEKKANELEADIEKKQEETAQLANIASKLEYTSRSQNNEILTKYKSQYYTLILRIIGAAVLCGAAFLLENCAMFGLELPQFMKPESYPVVYAMIDLQFIVLCAALVYRQIIDGIRNLVTLKPTPECITAFAIVLSVIYTITACLIAPRQGFRLYNLPVAIATLLALIYEFMNLKRDVFSFNVISTKRRKFVVTPVSDATESLEREIFSDYMPEDSQIIRVGKTDFVDGFFARVNENRVVRPTIGIMIPLVMILSVGFFILTFIKTQDVYQSLTMAFLTLTVTMPLTAFLIYSFPFYKAARDSYESDSAIIGETSLNDYASSSVISFEDREVFPPSGVKVTSIKVYGNTRIDEIIYNLASAFITVGGPLADVFSQATHDLGHSDNVVLEEVDEDGFTVTIDEIQVNIGKASYMEKQDYDPPYDAEDKRIESSAIGILYIAYQGQLAAKVYVQYTIDNEFEQILAQLYKTGMCVGIKSFDPNIDDLLLAKKIKAMKYPVKVIRSKTVEDIPHTFERCESGIVSKRSVKDLLKTVALCERVNGAIKTNLIVKVLAMLIGVVVMVFVYSFADELNITSLYVTLYQLIWVIPVMLISRFMV